MKNTIFFMVIAILFSFSCNSAKKALEKGNYNDAFYKSVKKLQKKPNDQEQAEIFTISYQKANQQDLDKINLLQVSNEKDIWEEIYKSYTNLDNRQKTAETVLPLRVVGKTTNFQHIDYSSKIVNAKKNAAEYFYRKGLELLMGDKLSVRNAYNHFVKAKTYSNNYSDIDQLMNQALEKGTTHVIITPLNKSEINVAPEYLFNLVDFGMQDLDQNWVKYYNNPQKPSYDYNIVVSIVNIYISPDQLKETKEEIKKDVEDGWLYEFDDKGNVKKDSLGNDIKHKKYKTISCNLISKTQRKNSNIEVTVEYQDNKTKRIIETTPLSASYEFQHISAFANGDLNALDEKTRKIIGQGIISFPTTDVMLKNLTDNLKQKIKTDIKNNNYRIK
ncbi:MAG: hypothetical protein JXR51_13785 [Bacteroidales bacterium]|nr:hypothetical protein [Bacteroidales bacterium]MBN2758238.1 hypothetical protein [Bacteroidales bacterium]